MKREFLTIPNLLSISRAILIIPFVLVMLLPEQPLRGWGAAVILLAMVTDKFDGVLARKRGEESEWGRILDPLADKLGVAAVALVLLRLGDIPLWFVAALIARDVLILLGGVYLKVTRGMVVPSNQAGKVTIGMVGVTLLIALFGVAREALWVCLGASTVGLLASFILYGSRFAEILRTAQS